MKDEKVREIWDSIVPDLVEEHFPKGLCKERGQAIVLIAQIYCEVLPKLNALYKVDHNCTTMKMAEQLDVPLWKVMELGRYFKSTFKIDAGKLKHIIKTVVAWGTEQNMDTETIIDEQVNEICQKQSELMR